MVPARFRSSAVLAAAALAAALAGMAPAHAAGDAAAPDAAEAVMEAFLEAFNARDEAAWADTLHFPHVRIAGGSVHVYAQRDDFIEAMDLERFAAETGWDHSTWDDMKVVQASPDKVHIAVTFTRYDAAGARMASYDSIYVVERVDGRWGVRARSSFAP